MNIEEAASRSGLVGLERPMLMDRGRAVQIAAGLRRGRPAGHMVRLTDYSEYMLEAPLELQRSERATLLFYDRTHRRAGVLWTKRRGARTDQIYGHWRLGDRRLGGFFTVGRSIRGGTQSRVDPVGYSPKSRRFYVAEHRLHSLNERSYSVTVVGVDERGQPMLAGQVTTGRRVHSVHFDSVGERAVVVEYASGGAGDTEAAGHLIDLGTGAQRLLALPPTAYGIAFHGGALFAASNRTGELWKVNLDNGIAEVQSRPGALSHALGATDRGLVLVRNAAVTLLDPATGRRRAALSTRKLFGGVTHAEGSLVARDQVVVANGSKLAFVTVTDRSPDTRPRRRAPPARR